VGDLVVFGRYAGSPIWIDGVEYLLLRDEEILGRRRKQGTENRD
jgi:co-chaperonin GroES (HSP10)